MILIDPITREEILLAKALGENVPDIVPVIRKEMYLAKIAGADISTPEAITREEMYLDAIANGTELTLAPITRKEMFYAKALGLIENAPEPITRIENLLNQIVSSSSGGFDKYSWNGVFASIKAGTYATDYVIGDMIPLDLGSEGLINMQIAAFDTDDLADGSGKAPITWIAKELLSTSRRMNPSVVANGDGTYQEGTGCVGGWEKCEMRFYLKNTIKPLIPENVRSRIVTVAKTHYAYDTANTQFTQTTEDDVWLPGQKEVDKGLYAQLFPDNASRIKSKVGSSTAVTWGLRDGERGYGKPANFYYIHTVGVNTIHDEAKTAYGIALGFCT